MELAHIDAGTLTFSAVDNSATGLLIPYGVVARSNLGHFTVDTGAFSLPADLRGASLNIEHRREDVVGGFSRVWEQPGAGVFATFSFQNTDAGRAAYEDAKAGRRAHLSAEVANVRVKDGRAIGGRLFAAALVTEPAFAGATLLAAADTPTDEEEPQEGDVAEVIDEQTTPAEIAIVAEEILPEAVTVTTTAGATATYTPIEEPQTMTANATVPATMRPAATVAQRTARVHLPTLFAALSRARIGMASTDDMALLAGASPRLNGNAEQNASTLLAALTDIKISGADTLAVGGGAIRENWVGQIDQGITYERQYVDLAKTGTEITAAGKKGYSVHRGTAADPKNDFQPVVDWAGNKTPIGSGEGFTKPHTSNLHRFAFGNDIAREYIDLPGGEEVLAAYFALIKEDHLIWSDEKARRAWLALAGAPIAVSGAIPGDYPAALGIVMQAIRAVAKPKADRRRDKASFVIVNDEAAEALDFTPFEHIPEFVKFSWNLDRSDLKAGDVVLVNGDNGITGSPAALAGAGYALELDELPGGPLWIDALEIAKGGIDRAVHGYLQEFQIRPAAVVLVGAAPTRANTTAYKVGDIVKVSAVVYRAVVAGTTSGANPTAPAVDATVTDGGVTWLRLV